ncbi:hypothetical protein H5410_016723 [Solanum commersonii]|uniref:SIS domain-containing protein n=1 Tax=Solanum commersonii TaxID=4109 RepID=A0A9J5ZXU6_SOLCO|nr:hypothetical protein H5410_016723 [Solanum commersonii]
MVESNPTESALLASKICNQISSVFSTKSPNPAALDVLVQEIADAANRNGRIFVYGVSREGLMLKALSMRLFHLGLSTHCVFNMNTPPIGPSDLLISSHGPWFLHRRSRSPEWLNLTAYASVVTYIPAQMMADDNAGDGEKERSLLSMGSVYEGAMFVLFEMVVFKLGEILKQSPEDVRARHTNLE